VVQLFSSLGPRIIFPLDPRAKIPLLALFFKINSLFLLTLTAQIQILLKCTRITQAFCFISASVTAYIRHIFNLEKLTFYDRVLRLIACVALFRKATDEIRITVFFISLRTKKINELVITSNKLTNNFAGLVTSSLGPDVAGHANLILIFQLLAFAC
jgi:hypothetical protein